MNTEGIHEKLRSIFGESVFHLPTLDEKSLSDISIAVKSEKIHAILKALKDDSELSFDNLLCITAVDFKEHFEVVYNLHSYTHLHKTTIKTTLKDQDNPNIESAHDLWKGANWLEREVYDMYGIKFNNHPDMTRILCPEDWQGYPLRKDYKEQESWHDIKVGM